MGGSAGDIQTAFLIFEDIQRTGEGGRTKGKQQGREKEAKFFHWELRCVAKAVTNTAPKSKKADFFGFFACSFTKVFTDGLNFKTL